MDLFKFNPTSDPTVLERGERINGTDSKMWIERYSEEGEVEIKAKLSSGLMDFLPEGTLIGNVRSLEVMKIDNQEVEEDLTSDPEITISGTSLPTWLENRILGVNEAKISSTVDDFDIASALSWNQIVTLINNHIQGTSDPDDELSNVVAYSSVTGSGTTEARQLEIDDLFKTVKDLLAVDDCGIRTLRRNNFGVTGSDTETQFEIYRGADISDNVVFSWRTGDLERAAYLFSGKKRKNAALIVGRWVWTTVDGAETNYDRRYMRVDARDIDERYTSIPIGGTLTAVLNKMATRGRQALKKQTNISISSTDIAGTSRNRYRRDYNLGDIVMLEGNFGERQKMRVVEYVEIEDQNGDSGHPTLALPGV